LKVVQHLLPFCLQKAFTPVIEVQTNLKAHGLPELQPSEKIKKTPCFDLILLTPEMLAVFGSTPAIQSIFLPA
jgi:hypothetical protein